jgi:hypothetical protein
MLSALAGALMNAELSRGVRFGSHIRVLHLQNIELGDDTDPWATDSLTGVLRRAIRLEEVSLPTRMNGSYLALLRRNCHQTLTSLTLPDHEGELDGRDLRHLAHFDQLVELVIKLQKTGCHECPEAGWKLPRLRTLVWEGTISPADNYKDSVFLAKCRFDALEVLHVGFMMLGELNYLTMFLRQHSFVEELSLYAFNDRVAAVLLPLVSCSTFTSLASFAPNGISVLPYSVRTLRLNVDIDGFTVRPVFDAYLASSGERTIERIQLLLSSNHEHKFCWKAAQGVHGMAKLVGNLIPYSQQLKARGTLLLDEDGEIIDDLPAWVRV